MKMYEALNTADFCKSIKDCKLSMKTAYKFNKLISTLEKEVAFYQEKFGELINTYGKKSEDGNYVYTEDGTSIAIIDGKEEECNNALMELRNLEVETPEIKFNLDELEPLNLSIVDMNSIMNFIEE